MNYDKSLGELFSICYTVINIYQIKKFTESLMITIRLDVMQAKRKMKKFFNFLLLCSLSVSFLFSACTEERKQIRFLEKTLEIDFKGATVTRYEDSHGWFGDGETFIICAVPENFGEQLQYPSWKSTPLSDSVSFLLDSPGICEDKQTQEKLIPFDEIENWLFFFVDDGPHNFRFAAFDEDENIFYYYEYDA